MAQPQQQQQIVTSDLKLRQATRERLKARVGISGYSGSGKSVSSLLIGYGLCGDWTKIAVIDSEERRGDLYVNVTIAGMQIGHYNVVTLSKPFHPERYLAAMSLCERSGMQVIIIDSITHAWDGTGGMLEQKDAVANSGGNSYFAWRSITPQHNALMDAILRSPAHLIVCCRAKVDYATETNAQGKIVPVKVGLKPIYREGIEYEFLQFFDMAQDHTAIASKDMTNMFGLLPFIPTVSTGTVIKQWLDTGQEPEHYHNAYAMMQKIPSLLSIVNGVPTLSQTWQELCTANNLNPAMQEWNYQESLHAEKVLLWYMSTLPK